MTVTINGTTGYSGPVGTIGDLTTTGNTTLGDASGDTLTINGSTTTLTQGTANGVAYLNASKVLTTGSALVFDGTNLGIGTTSPASGSGGGLTLGTAASGKSLHVYSSSYASNGLANFYGTDGSMKLQLGALSSASAYIFANTGCSLVFYSGGNTSATLDSSGKMMIGTSSDSYDSKLTVAGDAVVQWADNRFIGMAYSTGADYKLGMVLNAATRDLTIYNKSPSGGGGNRAIIFSLGATPSEAARFDVSGNLLVGTTGSLPGTNTARATFYSASNTLYAATSDASFTSDVVRFGCMRTASSAYNLLNCYSGNGSSDVMSAVRMYVRGDGGIGNYQANNVNLSDRREKTDFSSAGSYLEKICAIPVQTYRYIDQEDSDTDLTLGVVAQDVQEVAPELVTESNWGTEEEPKMRLSIYQTDLQYALMKCIQEQQAIIESLKARLDAANL